MTKYVIAGCFGNNDKEASAPATAKDEIVKSLDLLLRKKTLNFGINRAVNDLGKLNIYPTEVARDLLILAIMVQFSDTHLNRVDTSQDSWTREIKLVVPVSDRELWTGSKEVLQKMLSFLTGDFWEVEFRSRPDGLADMIKKKACERDDYSCVSLFSGGLDSLIGAIDSLESGKRPFFVSHAGEPAVSKRQRTVFDKLADKYGGIDRLRFISTHFPKANFLEIGRESSTRGRSFLFFALAAFVGAGFKGHDTKNPFELHVPENGLIALNVPLDPTRLGSLSTRTTHPYYIFLWQKLLNALRIPCHIFNPYQYKTKGEMIHECKNREFLKSVVPSSVSCAHPSVRNNEREGRHAHCGYCVPCIIRRAAIKRAWGDDKTGYGLSDLYTDTLNSMQAKGEHIRAYQYAIANLNANPNSALALIHKPGPLPQDLETLNNLANVYKRGMKEVECLLKGVKTAPPD